VQSIETPARPRNQPRPAGRAFDFSRAALILACMAHRRDRLRALFFWVCPLLALVAQSGCGIVGTWEAVPGDPFADRQNAPLARVAFRDDGTYSAHIDDAGTEATLRGKYRWTGWRLTVTPYAQPSQTYRAARWGRSIRLTSTQDASAERCQLRRVGK